MFTHKTIDMMREKFDLTDYYWTRLTILGIEYYIDWEGFVSTGEYRNLGHMSDCLEIGENLHNLIEICGEIDLRNFAKAQSIF